MGPGIDGRTRAWIDAFAPNPSPSSRLDDRPMGLRCRFAGCAVRAGGRPFAASQRTWPPSRAGGHVTSRFKRCGTLCPAAHLWVGYHPGSGKRRAAGTSNRALLRKAPRSVNVYGMPVTASSAPIRTSNSTVVNDVSAFRPKSYPQRCSLEQLFHLPIRAEMCSKIVSAEARPPAITPPPHCHIAASTAPAVDAHRFPNHTASAGRRQPAPARMTSSRIASSERSCEVASASHPP
jgi:hypothetical protein